MFSRDSLMAKIIIIFFSAIAILMLVGGITLGISSGKAKSKMVKETREYIEITGNVDLKEEYDKLETEQKNELLVDTGRYLKRYEDVNKENKYALNINNLGKQDKIIYLFSEGGTSNESLILEKADKYEKMNTGIPIEIVNIKNEDEISTFNKYYETDLKGKGDITKIKGIYVKEGKSQKEYTSVNDLDDLPEI